MKREMQDKIILATTGHFESHCYRCDSPMVLTDKFKDHLRLSVLNDPHRPDMKFWRDIFASLGDSMSGGVVNTMRDQLGGVLNGVGSV